MRAFGQLMYVPMTEKCILPVSYTHLDVYKRQPLYRAIDLPEAVNIAKKLAQSGDAVLLSPACASFDMFKNYIHRAEVFVQAVNALNAPLKGLA